MHWVTQHATLMASIAGCLLAVSVIAIAPLPVLRQPIVVTIGHVLAFALFVGLLGGGGILLGQTSLDHTTAESAARRDDLKRQLDRERARDRRDALSRSEVLKIARRTARLEKPTPGELLALLRRQAQACRARPRECARAAEDFRRAAIAPIVPDPTTSPPLAIRPAPGGLRRPGPRQPRPSVPSSPPPGQPGPSRPRPPVEVNPPPAVGPVGPLPPVRLPPLPQVCTPVLDIGCPTSKGHARRVPSLTQRPPR